MAKATTPKKPKRHCYDYPRPALTVDLLLVTAGASPRVLLIRRKAEPFAGAWAMPGGFVNEGESLEQAARRELLEETGVEAAELTQLITLGDPGRDPRGWTVSVAFSGTVNAAKLKPKAGDDAAEVAWFALTALPELAFDHKLAFDKLRETTARGG